MFTVYSKPNCPNCNYSKKLLNDNNIKYEEIIIDVGQKKDDTSKYITVSELKLLDPNIKAAPVIFKNSNFVGSYTELKQLLNKSG